ncbi:peptidase M23 [Ferruginivarius sediminum]|uniref:Peptidase M23 n=1 Tax=Ferruginivarius sediminum TaxID=2661937 RepID=A0A369T713_9PROT|nr:peptidase M23 [Ferruginivarius sediminum]
MILAFTVLALLVTPVVAPAQMGGRSAEEIEKEAEADRARAQALRRKANVLSEEVRALKAESVSVARRTQDLEADLSAVEETLASLQAEETAKQKELRDRRAQMTETLAALQRIAVQPPEALAVAPGSPMEVVRGAMMLRVAVPAIEGRAARLRGDLEELAKLRRDIEEQRETMRATAAKLAEERRHLSTLLDRKKELRARTAAQSEAAARRADKLAEEAADMRELLAHLRRQAEIRAEALAARTPKPPEKPAAPSESQGGASTAGTAATPDTSQVARLNRPPDIRAFPGNKASLRMPARGRVVTRYGERVRRAGGPTESRGIAIATRPAAQVVAPYDGQVVYAGPFKGYGRILIIEHGQRYHSLLAGLERIDAIVGQWVLAGEPVGVMGGSQGQNPELYVELRRTGQPINPLPWLAQTGDKVRG